MKLEIVKMNHSFQLTGDGKYLWPMPQLFTTRRAALDEAATFLIDNDDVLNDLISEKNTVTLVADAYADQDTSKSEEAFVVELNHRENDINDILEAVRIGKENIKAIDIINNQGFDIDNVNELSDQLEGDVLYGKNIMLPITITNGQIQSILKENYQSEPGEARTLYVNDDLNKTFGIEEEQEATR